MITKERLKAHIEDFPEEFSIDDLVERLIFIEKLEQRLKESKEGLAIPHEQAVAEMREWFK